ncbi:unnamed protein product [Didymodactylos carnosus]|nr:unnamed protein product [Didymodactylos carnosus]CAF4151328.1 unnamed protein product [Didymodactylos carnosus]
MEPSFSPEDDNVLIYRATSVPGYESDKVQLKLYSNGTISTLLPDWSLSIGTVTWSNDGQSVYMEVGEKARNVIYYYQNISYTQPPALRNLTKLGSAHEVCVHPELPDIFIFTWSSIIHPTEIYIYRNSASVPLSFYNSDLLQKVHLGTYNEFSFESNNDTVYGWHVQPTTALARNVPAASPLAFLIHGGPQSSWYDAWSFRWNFQSFAGAGYAVIAINFHGSDSYGQNFTDSITHNYGSLPYEDLRDGLTAALDQFSYIDGSRAIALGASYGGYMINWIAGQTEMNKRFLGLVCHDGMSDMRSFYYATEELWFPEHDIGGKEWENPDAYDKFNPIKYVKNWVTPMLIIQGGKDYRVTDTQSISVFTALQRKGIQSKMIYFPQENHWTLKAVNSAFWYETVISWMNSFTKK